MAIVHKLHKWRRRNAAFAATVASVSFLVLVLIFSVFLATQPHDELHELRIFFPGTSPPTSSSLQSSSQLLLLQQQPEEQQGGSSSSCQHDLHSLPDNAARCRYLSSPSPSRHSSCAPQGYVDYLRLFYCGFGSSSSPPWLGGLALLLWLVVLFYLLGDTASEYFCASLDGLSAALRLPPAVAGATLLSLGNGAPDVLSSVVAFSSSSSTGGDNGDSGDVGLSSVVGGALFVSTVVAGAVAIVAGRRRDDATMVVIERRGFVRDACFLLLALAYLLAVLLTGSVTVVAAASFLSLYAAYVLLVWTSHCCSSDYSSSPNSDDDDEDDVIVKPPAAANLATSLLIEDGSPMLPVFATAKTSSRKPAFRFVLDAIHAPLYLPRRLTIPDIAAHRWSKPYAVASALLSPLLLAATTTSSSTFLAAAILTGFTLASAAAHTLTTTAPPQSRWARVPWLSAGFLMSILWSYLLARELISLLVAVGVLAGVKPSVLGATVLAWGNSLGDLVADVAMAAHSAGGTGGGGPQAALAGCYAGPAFNTVVGLGLSLTMAAAKRFPEPYVVPADGSVYEAVGFLAAGLVWALVVLPVRGMRLDRVLGVGLLGVYLCFLCVRLGSLGGLGSSA